MLDNSLSIRAESPYKKRANEGYLLLENTIVRRLRKLVTDRGLETARNRTRVVVFILRG